ncbi:MAG TPA: DUF441 domain-containing protein [Firmicutes bacterium]|nr:DUF441 domain-containing protein [Bacillota bacterium]HAA33820.1 DUF441 domain-containing protein [Bacillota bacterium]
MNGFIFITVIFILGLLARSSSLTLAAGLLLLIKVLGIRSLLPLLEERGVELGLLFLMIAVLVPLALERVGGREILLTFSSLPGILAIAGGIIATRLNGMGLNLLESRPQVILGLVIGSIIGIVFFKGIPVGPLMAGGVAAFFLYVIELFAR